MTIGGWSAARAGSSDGAPEAWRGDERLALSVSISHRRGRAIAAVAGDAVGCDLEPVRADRDVVPFVGNIQDGDFLDHVVAETLPLRLKDNPSHLNFPGEEGHVRYGEGVLMGGSDSRVGGVALTY